MLESIISAECPHCKEPGLLRHGLCPDCLSDWLMFQPGCRCAVCHTEIRGKGTICQRCLESKDRFDGAHFLVPYTNTVRSWLHHVKFRDRLEWLGILELTTDNWLPVLSDWKPDVVSWIPSAPLTWWRRGYNLSYEIAKRVGRRMDIPIQRLLKPGALYKRPLSASRDPAHRRSIVRRFLKTARNVPDMKRVLLVDDVFTTGATLNRATRLIKERTDADVVYVFTIARVPDKP